MTSILLTIIGLASALLILILLGAGYYNSFVTLYALTQEGWSGIDVQLKRRHDLIPNLVETVKQYSIHEKTVLENITKSRSNSINASNIDQKSAAEGELTNALKTLFAVVENYPDLKANENFAYLQNSLEEIEEELQIARRYYNGTVRNYNITIKKFPANIVANFTSFSPRSYFELDNTHERTAPQVQF